MGAMYVPLEPRLREQLDALARRERRRPQDQAAVLLAAAVRHSMGRLVADAKSESGSVDPHTADDTGR